MNRFAVFVLVLIFAVIGTSFAETHEDGEHHTEAMTFVTETIKEHKVVMWAKSYCGFCRRAKGLLNKLDVDYFLYDLDLNENGWEVQDYLHKLTGRRTVPNIFINGVSVGGADDIQTLFKSRELYKLLDDAGVSYKE